MRTQQEINFQIEGLKEEKKSLPRESVFGDDNWAIIDAMLDVLEGKEVFDEDYNIDVEYAANEAEDWLNGDSNENLFG